MKRITWSLLAAGILLAMGCATSGQVRRLESDINQMQDYLQSFREENHSLDSTLNRNLGRLREQLDLLKKILADSNVKMDGLQQEIARVYGLIQELQYQQGQLASSIDRPPGMTEPTYDSETLPGETAPAADFADRLYREAYNDFIKGNYDLAIQGFREFILRYQESDMADNAQYWIGECQYTQGDYRQALQAFDTVISTYPNGDKIASSLLKKGYSLFELDKQSEALEVLESLIQDHPRTEEARLAEHRIEFFKSIR